MLPPSKKIKSRFEYWPWWVFYIPIFFKYSWYSLRTGNLSFIGAVNPNMYLGGLWEYSKYDAQKEIPELYNPSSFLLKKGVNMEMALSQIHRLGISWPLIVKPDMGERGHGVYLIKDEADLHSHWGEIEQKDQIFQEYISLSLEAGILYSRSPDEENGNISSLMIREFLYVKGDGHSTCADLIKAHPRYRRHLESLEKLYPESLKRIPKSEEKIDLEMIGNHNRGTIFRNGNSLITAKMTSTYDRIAKSINGFHFGRIDVKARDLESLESGIGIKILELNGVNSEPAHIYDPDYSLFHAYEDLLSNWTRIYEIACKNHKEGIPFPASGELRKSFFKRISGWINS
jgi:hypothetical protein